jgi:hypothetical protein
MPAPPPRRRIVIEFEPGHDPVAGTISAPSAAPREFCGWLELISTLDRQFAGNAESASRRDERSGTENSGVGP